MGAVLPLVADPEPTVQERCLKYVDELILQRMLSVLQAHSQGKSKSKQAAMTELEMANLQSVWALVSCCDEEMLSHFQRAVSLMVGVCVLTHCVN